MHTENETARDECKKPDCENRVKPHFLGVTKREGMQRRGHMQNGAVWTTDCEACPTWSSAKPGLGRLRSWSLLSRNLPCRHSPLSTHTSYDEPGCTRHIKWYQNDNQAGPTEDDTRRQQRRYPCSSEHDIITNRSRRKLIIWHQRGSR